MAEQDTRAIFEEVLAEQVIPLLNENTRDIAALKDDVAELKADAPRQDRRIAENTRDIASLKDDIAAIPTRTALALQPTLAAFMRDEWERLSEQAGLADAVELGAQMRELRGALETAQEDIASWKALHERWNVTRRIASIAGERAADVTQVAAVWARRLAVLYGAYEVAQRAGWL